MTYQDAFDEARAICSRECCSMALVHHPLGRDDWETEDEAYVHMPPSHVRYFPHARLLLTFRPVTKGVQIVPA